MAYSKSKTAKPARKRSKRATVTPAKSQAISAMQRREMQDALRHMNKSKDSGGMGKSYRWIARHTVGASRFGWLQRVATGKRDVTPTKHDLDSVRRLYDWLQEESDIDGKRLDYALRNTELLAALQQNMTDWMRMERNR